MSESMNPYEPPKENLEQPIMESSDTPSDVAIKLSGRLSVQDCREAMRLAKQKASKNSKWFRRYIAIGVFGLMSGFCVYKYITQDTASSFPVTSRPWIFLSVAVVCIGYFLWSSRRSEHKRWVEGKGVYAHNDGQVDWQSIESRTKSSSTTMLWSNFCGYRHTDRVAVLYEEFPNMIAIYSRNRFAKDEDWDAFLELVAQKLSPL